jgi:hypothetical protein
MLLCAMRSSLFRLVLSTLLLAGIAAPMNASAQDYGAQVVLTADGSKLTPAAEAWVKNYSPAEDNLWRSQGKGYPTRDGNIFKRGLFDRLFDRAYPLLPWAPGTLSRKEICHPYFPNGCWLMTRDDRDWDGGPGDVFYANDIREPATIGPSENWLSSTAGDMTFPGLWEYNGTELFHRHTGKIWASFSPEWHCGTTGAPAAWGETLRSAGPAGGECMHINPVTNWPEYDQHPAYRGITVKHVVEDIRMQPDDPNIPNATICAACIPNWGPQWSNMIATYLRDLPDNVEQRIIQWIASRLGPTSSPYDPLLAAQFRPTLRFDSAESYRPLSVDQFVSERDDAGDPIHDICNSAGGCFPLLDVSSFSLGNRLDIAGDGNADNFHSPYTACTQDSLRDCDTGPRSAIYYWETPRELGHTNYIDYWFFYRYNDWPFDISGDHEGDWESVTLGQSVVDPREFAFASFSQHGYWYSYLRENMRCDGGGAASCGTRANPEPGRLDVFVAQGSHANYPIGCVPTPDSPCDVRSDPHAFLGEGSHNGGAAWGNNSASSALMGLDDPRVKGGWAAWSGKWGADGSPSGPGHGPNEAHFQAPWQSDCARDNEDDCASEFTGASAGARSAATRGNDRCGSWFGGGVVAVACDPIRLHAAVARGAIIQRGSVSFSFRSARTANARDGRSQGSAPGVAQALGRPLRPGERMLVRSRARTRADLLIRTATRRWLVEARFDDVDLARGRPSAVMASVRAGRPTLRIVRSDERPLRPTAVRRVSLAHPRRPVLRGMHTEAGRVRLRLSAEGRSVRVTFTQSRLGPALADRFATVDSPVQTIVTRVPRGARYVSITGVDGRARSSAPLVARLR